MEYELEDETTQPSRYDEKAKEFVKRDNELVTEKFDVLRDRLLGNHNDFHWQLGGQINHQPCSCKAAQVIRCTELDSAVSSF